MAFNLLGKISIATEYKGTLGSYTKHCNTVLHREYLIQTRTKIQIALEDGECRPGNWWYNARRSSEEKGKTLSSGQGGREDRELGGK